MKDVFPFIWLEQPGEIVVPLLKKDKVWIKLEQWGEDGIENSVWD